MDLITKKIQKDWNDRIKLHPRFWMGDKFDSNEDMWESGKRDLDLILEDFNPEVLKEWQVLEYGCGSGRILPAASNYFRHIVGVDVSSIAIEIAKESLKNLKNIKLFETTGADLKIFEKESFDFCYSFACLNHVPLKILSNILIELTRVIKKDGFSVFQLYVGQHPSIVDQDTLTIRGYPEQNLRTLFELLGYKIISAKPLNLPFDAHDSERNLTPYLFSLQKINDRSVTISDLENCLNPNGELQTNENWKGSHFEYRLAATLLKEQSKKGNLEESIKTLEFAIDKYKNSNSDDTELLAKLKALRDVNNL